MGRMWDSRCRSANRNWGSEIPYQAFRSGVLKRGRRFIGAHGADGMNGAFRVTGPSEFDHLEICPEPPWRCFRTLSARSSQGRNSFAGKLAGGYSSLPGCPRTGTRRLAPNSALATSTIVGPAGTSYFSDPNRPAATESTPSPAAPSAICSGVVTMRRAAAAGIMTIATISSMPTIFMPTAITAASMEQEQQAHPFHRDSLHRCKIPVHRNREKVAPLPDKCDRDDGGSPEDQPEIYGADGKDVAEQVADKIDSHPIHESDDDESRRKDPVRQNTEQGIDGNEPLALQQSQATCEQEANPEYHQGGFDAEQEAEGDPEKHCMRERCSEIRHAPPDHETADRSGRQRYPDPARQCAQKEILHQWRLPDSCDPSVSLGSVRTALPCRSCW